MSNWNYGFGKLPSEMVLKETQNTKDVKQALKALEASFTAYKGYMTKATAGSQDGSITDPKSFAQAEKSMDNLKQAVTSIKDVLTYFQKGLVVGNKKLGGGLNAQTLDALIKNCEAQFDKIRNNMRQQANGQQQNNQQNNQQNAQQNTQNNNQNAQQTTQQVNPQDLAAKLQNASPEVLSQIAALLQ